MSLTCRILSPERAVYEGKADSVTLPAHDGGMGVLPRHAPMIGRLGDGVLVVRREGGEERFAVFGGFYRILGEEIAVLTDDARPAAEIDEAAVASAREAASGITVESDEGYAKRRRADVQTRVLGRLSAG